MENDLLAYAGYFVSYALERLHHPVKEIILFGSAARGDSTSESDVDIFFDVDQKAPEIERELAIIKGKFYKSIIFDTWEKKGFSYEINIKVGLLKEWELYGSVLSDGIVLYGKFKEQVRGNGYALFSIVPITKVAKRNRIIRHLFGRMEKKIKRQGLVDKYGGKRIAPTVFFIPLQFSGKAVEFLKKEKVNYEIREMWSDVI